MIASDGRNFCVGANLLEIGFAAQMGMFDTLSKAVEALQRLDLGLRYAPKPVVAAVRGQTLGGGAEIALHAARIVAAAETYMGLVETGVGLIPSGGGCKEMLRRHLSPPMRSPGAAPLPHLRRVFETIGLAKVSTSALEARELGYLSPGDPIVMHADHVLSVAKAVVLALAGGYRPPERGNVIYAAGRDAAAALEVGVWQMMWGRHISEYDGVIGRHLARVLACGDLSAPQWVPEEYVLGLERQAFLELLRNKQTLERMEAVVRR